MSKKRPDRRYLTLSRPVAEIVADIVGTPLAIVRKLRDITAPEQQD
jgi:hypothetical protein